jgi:glycosyltransferase involved in cell wall biosynthesis
MKNGHHSRVAVLVRQFPKLSETFILGEIASLVDAGIDVRIISLHRPTETLRQPDASRFDDCVVYADPKSRLGSMVFALRLLPRIFSVLRQLRELGISFRQFYRVFELCQEFEIAHIHAHYISGPALIADLVSQLRKHSFSVSAHAKDIYLTDTAAIRERLRNAAFVTTCTAHNQTFLLQHECTRRESSRVHLLYHGVDSERFRPAAPQSATPIPTLIGVGRYKRKKGFDLLITACAKLVAEAVPLRCEIIGYGSEERSLNRLIAAYNLGDYVSLRAPVSHHDLVGLLQNATVCVLPCRQTEDGDRDGIPNSMLEAMSCEVPVVSTTVSGIPEVIESETNGLLVAPEDVAALAGAIRRVLNDDGLRDRLAKNGRRTVVELFCWESNIAVLSELLRTTIATPVVRQSV